MNKERIRLIIRNIELLIKQLEIEIEDDDMISNSSINEFNSIIQSIKLNMKRHERKEIN
jgi:hypothetical protein